MNVKTFSLKVLTTNKNNSI